MIYTDGKTILGADDRAGVAVLLHLIRNNIPGTYMFFVGEESGRIGSEFAALDGAGAGFKRMICWDRMGTDSIITHQMMERSCSADFAEELRRQYGEAGLEMKLDPHGTYTDSFSFIGEIPECTNISVGYWNQHTTTERQDARFLVHMAEASVAIDWERLPATRDPHVYESATYAPWNQWEDDWQPTRFTPVKTTRNPQDSAYYTPEDLIQGASWGVLTYTDVEDYLYNDPEEAARLLYDLLTGNMKGQGY